MDQLKGKIVNVVLTIQEGRAIDSFLLPTTTTPAKFQAFISANFNGRILESDPISPEDDTPLFNTNLIWEIEKRDLRKIRSANQPLRVECLTLDPITSRKERFGHLLLDLRSANVLTDAAQIPFKWYKLLGVRNRKRNTQPPELFVSLTIRNRLQQDDNLAEEMFLMEPRPDAAIPIKYLDDGYIIVGDEANQHFSLNILIKSATNLDLLLPEVLVFNANKNKYSLCLKIFGVPINTKQFNRSLHEKIVFDERIVVRLQSTHDTLKDFFKDEEIEVGFYSGHDLLGLTMIPFAGLANLNEKMMLGNCFFKFPSTNGIVPCIEGRKPSLSLEISLLRIEADLQSSSLVENGCGGDFLLPKSDQLQLITAEQVKELEDWKEEQRKLFYLELEAMKQENDKEFARKHADLDKKHEEFEARKSELEEKLRELSKLQDELNLRLDEINLAKELRKKRKSQSSIHSSSDLNDENQKRFQDCDKNLLIDYITQLQADNEDLKERCAKQKQELDNIERTALTKEQTATLLHELKGLEEKFQVAQQTKTYFKEQWKRACEEIHAMKAEDYRQMQSQLKERRQELSQLSLDEPCDYSLEINKFPM